MPRMSMRKVEKPYTAIPDSVILSGLPPAAFKVYCLLAIDARRYHGGLHSDLSVRQLAELFGIDGTSASLRTIQKCLKDLEESGFIRKVRRKGSNVWETRFNYPSDTLGWQNAGRDLMKSHHERKT